MLKKRMSLWYYLKYYDCSYIYKFRNPIKNDRSLDWFAENQIYYQKKVSISVEQYRKIYFGENSIRLHRNPLKFDRALGWHTFTKISNIDIKNGR